MSAPFPSLLKRRLFEILRDRVDQGLRCPSLALIARLMKLDGPEQAERLLKDMQRDGVINMLRGGDYPWLEVLRNTYTGDLVKIMKLDPEKWGATMLVTTQEHVALVQPISDSVPTARVSAPAPAQTDAMEVDGGPRTPPVSASRPIADAATLAGGKTTRLDQVDARGGDSASKHVHEPPPRRKSSYVRPSRAKPKSEWKPRGLPPSVARKGPLHSIKIDDATYCTLKAEAAAQGVPMLQVMRSKLNAQPPEQHPTGKPHIRANVMRAWRDDGRPFGDFITALIDLGLAEYLDFRAGLK